MDVNKYAPKGYKLYDYQVDYIQEVLKELDTCDVLVLDADTGSGKSVILQTIANFLNKTKKWTTATITPKVQLQDQYDKQFKDTPILKGMARYRCREIPELDCKEKREMYGNCDGCECPFVIAKKSVEKADNAVFNFHSYILNKVRKDVIIVDEAHNIYNALSDMQSLKVWKHVSNYPENLVHYSDITIWLEKEIENLESEINFICSAINSKTPLDQKREILKEASRVKKKLDKFRKTCRGIQVAPTNYFVEHSQDYYKGEMKDQLRLRPTTLEKMPAYLWGDSTQKIILASGTIREIDIKKFGLSRKRVKFFKMPAPIAAEDRPIKCEFIGNMAWKYQNKNMPRLLEKIKELKARHKDTKGIVHMPYNMSMKLKKIDTEKSFIYHDQENKDKKLKEFMDSPPGTVLIACGMDEGLDLPGREYGWQAIAKVQYPSKSDKLIEDWYENDPEWIKWLTARTIIQQSGRINRKVGDKGVTYFLDTQFGNEKKRQYGFYQRAKYMFPDHFKRRIQW